jgi:N-methylhydantoinase B
MGGIGLGADGRQVYEEGIYIPTIPLAKRGKISRSLFGIIAANMREPAQVEADLSSLAACNDTGSERLRAMCHP